ncbi:MAG: DUF2461 domain-containing protein [Bacteroides sp.]|nr:DUF2461 domain-containing protein [Bacillota bacterium]MCM1393957.1 DUF2461 domain-containing protein [[Eubacterium] siraeum]MCM1455134.1 DUF2461 domain-containing protein [Bacteroides sp.]
MFTQRTLDFLYFNHKYNSKKWYQEHKEDYHRYIVEPFAELVLDLTPTMLSIDPKFIVEPKIDRTISRIYRDMRYASDGYLYRDKTWCVFMRDKKLYNGLPGFFFELSPYGFRYGCGYYQADGQSVKNFRQLIIDNSKEYRAALKCYKNQDVFHLYGEKLKTSRYPDLPEDAQEWLMLKNAGLIAESQDINLLFSENLSKILAEQFLSIKPFYDMLNAAEEMK